jgi:hypothetical protein
MTFSRWTDAEAENNQAAAAAAAAAMKRQLDDNAARQPTIERQQSESRAVSDANTTLANKKALDAANRKAADYAAGIADPLETLAETKKLKDAQESALTDYEQYDRKAALDLRNQSAAWADASKYRQSDAAQDFGAQKDRLVTDITGQKDRLVANLDTQKEMQRAGFNQTNTLRRDDNQRAIDGFKMNF